MTLEQIEKLADFLDGLDWMNTDSRWRAEQIGEFIASDFDMETYEYRNNLEGPLLPLRVIDGGRAMSGGTDD